MATPKQLREVFAPILAEHPDLVLHKRWLFRPPIETAIIGLHIGRTAYASASDMYLSVIPLSRFSQPSVLGFKRGFEVERVIGVPPPGRLVPGWQDRPSRTFGDMFAPEYQAHLIRNFNAKVPAFLNSVRSLEDVIAWVLSLRGSFFDSAPVEFIDGWIATMRGDFAMAADRLEAYFVRMRPLNSVIRTERQQMLLDVQSILRTNDAKAIAAHLHAMEEATIAAHGLQRHWRRTPFPFER